MGREWRQAIGSAWPRQGTFPKRKVRFCNQFQEFFSLPADIQITRERLWSACLTDHRQAHRRIGSPSAFRDMSDLAFAAD
jgi:hypothetical protein